ARLTKTGRSRISRAKLSADDPALPGAALLGRNGPFLASHAARHDLIRTGRFAPGQRRTPREADLSTLETGAQAPPRLPRPSRHCRRPQGPRRAPRPGPQASERLSRLFRRLLIDRLRQRADFLAVADGARVN